MSVIGIIALAFVIVGIVFGVIDNAWRNPLFWFVLAFAVLYIIGPVVTGLRAGPPLT